MPDLDSAVFSGSIEEKIKLDAKIITSEAQTQLYTDKEEILNGNVIEVRPKYPNFTLTDIAVANLPDEDKDQEEELAIRLNAETAIHGQHLGQKYFEDIPVDKIEIVRLQTTEPLKKVLVLSGFFENQEVIVQSINDRGQVFNEKIVATKMPFFRFLEGEDIPVYEERHIKRIERRFMNLTKSSTRLHSIIMTRLGLTKSRGMRGAAAIHEEHLKRTTIGTPMQVDLEADKEKGF